MSYLFLSCTEKKINVLSKQLEDNGVIEFDPKAYLEELSNV